MLLDARKGDAGWEIWDVRRCYRPVDVVWVDDTLAQWGQWKDKRPKPLDREVITRQEEKIQIIPEKKLILLNPVPDSDDSSDQWKDTIPVGEVRETEWAKYEDAIKARG